MQWFLGAVTRIRTGDLILTKDALYLLSYNSISDSFDIIASKAQAVNYFFSKIQLFLRKLSCGGEKLWYNSFERM